MNGIHQRSVCAVDTEYVSGEINTIKETKKAVLVASREGYLEVNNEKNEYMLIPYEQSAGCNHNLKMADK
jgi:hypothetical protein